MPNLKPTSHATPMNRRLISPSTAIMAAIFGSYAVSNVYGHGHLTSPRSRNYYAKEEGKWRPADGNTTPKPESCSHCLNIGGTEASCGITGGSNYDYPKNSNGGPLPPVIQACYAEEDVIELKVTLTAHHMGHFEYKACPINPGEVASQECFDSNKLIFVEDVLYGSLLPDPDHLNRAYIPRHDASFIRKDEMGSYLFSHLFKLPPGLSGELVLLQWHYITANSCLPDEGYLNYDFPVGFEPKYNLGICKSIPPDGRGVPEQFWNCAEVRISSDCGNEQPASSSSPRSTSTTTKPATKYTSTSTTVATTTTTGATTTTATKVIAAASMTRSGDELPPPLLAPSSRRSCPAQNYICGPNNPCKNGMCCSQWGYCGITKEYCGECCQSNCSLQPPSPPTSAFDEPPLLVQEVIATNADKPIAAASKASKSSDAKAIPASSVDESDVSEVAAAASIISKSSKSLHNMTPETPSIVEEYASEMTENLEVEYKGEDSAQAQGSNSQGLTRTQVSAAGVYFMSEEENEEVVPLWRSLPFIVGFAFLVGVLATLAHLAIEKGRHKKAEKLKEGTACDKQTNKDAACLPKEEYIEVYLPDSKQAEQVDASSQEGV